MQLYNSNAHFLPAFDELNEPQQHSDVPLTLLSADNEQSSSEAVLQGDVPVESSFDIVKLNPVNTKVEARLDQQDEVPQTLGSLEKP